MNGNKTGSEIFTTSIWTSQELNENITLITSSKFVSFCKVICTELAIKSIIRRRSRRKYVFNGALWMQDDSFDVLTVLPFTWINLRRSLDISINLLTPNSVPKSLYFSDFLLDLFQISRFSFFLSWNLWTCLTKSSLKEIKMSSCDLPNIF